MRGRFLVAVTALAALTAAGGALALRDDSSYHFEVLAQANPGGRGYSADVILYRRHAYLSSYRGKESCAAAGVRVFDLRLPSAPQRISTFGRIAGTWTEKTIVRPVATASFTGDVAVTSLQGCTNGAFRGFALYDVTHPGRPRELARVRTDPRGTHEIWLQPVGRRAYVYTAIIASEIRSSPDGRTPGKPDFRIFDVTDPRRPVEVGGWGAWQELGLRPFENPSDRLRGNFVHSVTGDGTHAYLSYWDLGTVVLDVSDPAAPRYLGRTHGRTDNSHSAWLGRRGLLVETHEATGGMPAFYRRTGRDPVLLGRFELPNAVVNEGHRVRGLHPVQGLDLADSVHDAKLQGNLAVFSWYSQGVVVADVTNAAKPRFLARFLPRAGKDPEKLLCPGRRCVAVWGVDVEGDLVVASDMLGGLWVLRLNRDD
jgi:hypothetical protein